MCGRYTQTGKIDELAGLFDFEPGRLVVEPRYNMAPGQPGLVIVPGATGNRPRMMKWGLVPHWAKQESVGYKMINARSETVAEKPAFKSLLAGKRCLVPADGFYEWSRTGGRKSGPPHRFTLPDEGPFAMAGLWSKWQIDDREPVWSYTVITTQADETVAPFHDRMPVILGRDGLKDWLDRSVEEKETLALVLKSQQPDLVARPASTLVNSVRNEGPELWLADEEKEPKLF